MSRIRIRQVDIALPNAHLDGANWADTFEAITPESRLNAS